MGAKQKTAVAWGRLKQTGADLFVDVTSHWKKPGKGKYVPYKELLSLGLGGMGQQLFTTTLLTYVVFSASNTLLGATIGLRPMHLQYMAMIQTVLNVFFYIVRGKIVDSTRSRFGRFRPYIAIMGVPLAVLGTIYVFLDFGTMAYNNKLILSFLFCIAISMISPFLTDTYTELVSCMTPNSKERTVVMTVNSLVYSFMPTITNLFVPILTTLTGGYTDIKTYRYIIIPLTVVGCGFNLFTAFGCKERVISSKTYVQKIGLWEGCAQIFRNKYWHLRNIAGAIGFAEGACGVLFSWIYIYSTQDMVTYGLLNTLLGTASGIAMLLTPYILSKLGNKKILLFHNGANVVFVTLMMFTFKVPWLFFIMLYLNTLVSQLAIVYNPAQHAEVKDYQQYLSGKRMDFTFGAAGQIMVPITLATGLVLPLVFEAFGLTTNYDVLYDPMVRNNMFYVLCAMSAAGAFLNLVPYFFYGLSREKHRNYIKVIQYRAVLQDYANGDASPELIKSAIEGVREAYEITEKPMPDLKDDRLAIKEAKSLSKASPEDRANRAIAIKAARRALASDKRLIEAKAAAKIVLDEIDKFDNPLMIKKVQFAQKIAAVPLENLIDYNKSILAEARKLPVADKTDKKFRRYSIKQCKAILKSARLIKRHFPEGIKPMTAERVQAALDMPAENRAERIARAKEIKAAEKEFNLYTKVASPYLKAKELVKEYEIKDNFQILEQLYEQACVEVAEKDARRAEIERAEREEKQAELARLREERWSKLPPEKAEKKRAAYAARIEKMRSIQQAIINTSKISDAEIPPARAEAPSVPDGAEEDKQAAADIKD